MLCFVKGSLNPLYSVVHGTLAAVLHSAVGAISVMLSPLTL